MMDSETLDRIKRNMLANRFSEAALTVIPLHEGHKLIAEIERLQQKANDLYKAASAIVDQVIEAQAFGAEFDEDGFVDVKLHKDEVESLVSVVLNWDK